MSVVTYSLPPDAFRTLRPEPRRGGLRVWDVALTVVLLVLLPLAALAATSAGLLFTAAGDSCFLASCDLGLVNFGLWFAVIAPWAALVIGVTAAIVRLVRHRIAFWVPLLTVIGMVALWFVAAAIVGAGVSPR